MSSIMICSNNNRQQLGWCMCLIDGPPYNLCHSYDLGRGSVASHSCKSSYTHSLLIYHCQPIHVIGSIVNDDNGQLVHIYLRRKLSLSWVFVARAYFWGKSPFILNEFEYGETMAWSSVKRKGSCSPLTFDPMDRVCVFVRSYSTHRHVPGQWSMEIKDGKIENTHVIKMWIEGECAARQIA